MIGPPRLHCPRVRRTDRGWSWECAHCHIGDDGLPDRQTAWEDGRLHEREVAEENAARRDRERRHRNRPDLYPPEDSYTGAVSPWA